MKNRAFQLAAILCLAAGASKATSAPILELTVTPEPGATAIVLAVSNDAGERRDVLGFHIYRAEFTGVLSEGCADIVRVTDDFLPRQFGNSSYSFQVEDDVLVEGRAYRYYLEGYPPVTSGPDLSNGFDTEKSWVPVTMGQALFAVSTHVLAFGGRMIGLPCATGCTLFIELDIASAPSEIVNMGGWRLFGTVRPRTDVFGFELVVDSALPERCVDEAVVPSAWGTVKSLYR